MEPWFGNHGNIQVAEKSFSEFAASMEPWFGNHGNVAPTQGLAKAIMLQWSRGSVTTETKGYSTKWMNAQLLQWSRGSVTTETSGKVQSEFRLYPLQWSRGSVTTETLRLGHQGFVPPPASMEPWFGNHGNTTLSTSRAG